MAARIDAAAALPFTAATLRNVSVTTMREFSTDNALIMARNASPYGAA